MFGHTVCLDYKIAVDTGFSIRSVHDNRRHFPSDCPTVHILSPVPSQQRLYYSKHLLVYQRYIVQTDLFPVRTLCKRQFQKRSFTVDIKLIAATITQLPVFVVQIEISILIIYQEKFITLSVRFMYRMSTDRLCN